MILDRLFGILLGKRGPVGLHIELGSTSGILSRSGHSISGSGPYMKMHGGGYRWKRKRGKTALIPAREANPHVLVSGMSGFGKSMLFKSMLIDAAKAGLSCIVFDGHNEHVEVVKKLGGRTYNSQDGGINLLSLDGATVSDRTAALTSLFSGVYRLGHIQSTKLGQCLWYTYRRFGARAGSDRALGKDPKIGDLLFEIGIFIRNAKTASERATLVHLQSKISNLNTPAFNSNIGEGSWAEEGIHSFSVSERMSREARLIYLVELLERVYSRMKHGAKAGGVRQYIMIDESQVLINESEECSGIITKFIEEGRKYGRGVIIVTHMSSKLNRQIVANSATFVAFYSREPSETSYVAKVMSSNFDAEQAVRSRLAGLLEGDAMVVSASNRTPRVVSTMELRGKVDQIRAAEVQETESKEDPKRRNPGTEHEMMVETIQSCLNAAGVRSYIHDRANGPDIVAFGPSGRIAIEYETGSKNLKESLEMLDRRKGHYSAVVLVVNDAHFQRYSEAWNGDIVKASQLGEVVGRVLGH